MIKHPGVDEYKIIDYTDFIGWIVLSMVDTGRKTGTEKIFYMQLMREGCPEKIRRVYSEARYIPLEIFVNRGRKR